MNIFIPWLVKNKNEFKSISELFNLFKKFSLIIKEVDYFFCPFNFSTKAIIIELFVDWDKFPFSFE